MLLALLLGASGLGGLVGKVSCVTVTKLLGRLFSENTVLCLTRLGRLFKIRHYCTKLAFCYTRGYSTDVFYC